MSHPKSPVPLGKAIGGTFVAVTLFALIIALVGLVRGSDRASAVTASPAPSAVAAAPTPAPKVMPNLVGLTSQQYLSPLVAVYPGSHPATDDDGSDPTATIVSQEPAAGTALQPEDGNVVLHMSDAAKSPPASAATDTDSDAGSGSRSGSRHFPHAHICVGGRHIHVCS